MWLHFVGGGVMVILEVGWEGRLWALGQDRETTGRDPCSQVPGSQHRSGEADAALWALE